MNDKEPTISVIIPAYNVQDYLSDAVHSVLNQTFDDYEIIIVNDGSTDNTQTVIDDFVCSYPSIIHAYYEENSGQSAARNLAMKYAKGEYIAFVDSDDLLDPSYLRKLYDAAKNSSADMAKCSIADFSDTIESAWHACDIGERTIEFEPEYVYSFHNSAHSGIMRKKFLEDYEIRFSEGEQMEDTPHGILTNLLANKVAIVDEYLYYHRVQRAGSTMTKVFEGKENPNIPYHGMINAAELLDKYISDPVKKDIAEYFVMNSLACFVTEMYKNYGKDVRKRICNFCYQYIAQYYPSVRSNPFIFGRKAENIKKLPFFQREAVRLLSLAYRMKLLYPFSWMYSLLARKG
ncbi:MAG: glycosyltransferase family 2 protein [Eubacteriales bacterium]|nr:glycosyltransferase family 2 protein [Eubacteriales bacterium]